jgi:hypothetical protein
MISKQFHCFTAILLFLSFFAFSQTNSVNSVTTEITITQLLEANSVEDLLPGFPKDEYNVVNYNLTIVPKGKDLHAFVGNNKFLSEPMKTIIRQLHPGDKLYFEYVNGKSKTKNKFRSFPPFVFSISGK